jgi:hypothetical protein
MQCELKIKRHFVCRAFALSKVPFVSLKGPRSLEFANRKSNFIKPATAIVNKQNH